MRSTISSRPRRVLRSRIPFFVRDDFFSKFTKSEKVIFLFSVKNLSSMSRILSYYYLILVKYNEWFDNNLLRRFEIIQINSYFNVRTILYVSSIISNQNKLISVFMILSYVVVLSHNSHYNSFYGNFDIRT